MRDFWYVAAEARTLGKKPLARRILDFPIVLFRDAGGRAIALPDRCPHRIAPLSLGRCENGTLACAYHGWRFDGDGRCVAIPSLNAREAIPKAAHVAPYPTIEQDGYVWVWPGDRPPRDDERPFFVPRLGEKGAWHARMEAVIENGVEHVIENFIDCAHTGYVHGGLFRAPASHQASTRIAQTADGVVIDIDEERASNSVLSRVLVRKDQAIAHQDRFILPSIVQVAYRFGDREITGYQICTPESEWRTRVYVVVVWSFGWLSPLLRPIVPLAGRLVLHQDRRILNRQAEAIRSHGKHFVSTPCDTANLWIQASRQKAAAGESAAPREKQVDFRL